MTFEERLRRIAERHEALAQHVEILTTMQEANEETLRKNQTLMAQMIEGINSLARIVHSHENRITHLEG